MKKFHENLTYVVDEILKVSSYDVRNAIGFNAGGFISIKNGKVNPGVALISKFCLHYDISPTYLFFSIGPIKLSEVGGEEGDEPQGYSARQIYSQKRELGNLLNSAMDILQKAKAEYAV